MIDRIEGKIVELEPTYAVVEVGGIGFYLAITLNTFEAIGRNKTFRFFTYLHVREDILQLYGFAEKGEREAFIRLISVSGIGPKVGQAMLSSLNVKTLRDAVRAGDWKRLTAAPGVGRKIAERLIIELRGVFGKEEISDTGQVSAEGYTDTAGAIYEAVQGLTTLGYSQIQAEKLVTKAAKNADDEISVEELIRKSLRP
ncbi:MAG: Holliday junction branch migration protein RuvA [Candidatus Electryonea clarkiae]|nr:Holliday junction branch migration protein RuvA [Candidatus Electryonea clarkiae]MDP8286142.1 Holliday junction branch migration protein RuvA [Candidatus Electryonea clarkiae]